MLDGRTGPMIRDINSDVLRRHEKPYRLDICAPYKYSNYYYYRGGLWDTHNLPGYNLGGGGIFPDFTRAIN